MMSRDKAGRAQKMRIEKSRVGLFRSRIRDPNLDHASCHDDPIIDVIVPSTLCSPVLNDPKPVCGIGHVVAYNHPGASSKQMDVR